jgi:hypothetical protein
LCKPSDGSSRKNKTFLAPKPEKYFGDGKIVRKGALRCTNISIRTDVPESDATSTDSPASFNTRAHFINHLAVLDASGCTAGSSTIRSTLRSTLIH